MPTLPPISLPQPMDPYHWNYDQSYLLSLYAMINIINGATDANTLVLGNAAGNAGSVAARLNVSLDDIGNLLAFAINAAEHSIEDHTDGDTYVRMEVDERAKLAGVDDEANDLQVQFDEAGISNSPVLFENGIIEIENSSTISWNFTGGKIVATMAFSPEAAHQHYYDSIPVPVNSISPDYINYKVNSFSTPYIDGSLRVYINGIRISTNSSIYAPGAIPTDTWTINELTTNSSAGTFSLSAAITSEDVIIIDYDIALT